MTRIETLFLDSDEGRRHVAFFAAIPDDLLPWMAPFWWDLSNLLALDLPAQTMLLDDLAQFLDVPFWRAGAQSGLFQLTARDVAADPVTHADHWQRTMATDLSYPITLYDNDGQLILLDGYHRLLKAHHLGVTALPARIVPESSVPHILNNDGFLGQLNALRTTTPDLIAELRHTARHLIATSPPGTWPAWT